MHWVLTGVSALQLVKVYSKQAIHGIAQMLHAHQNFDSNSSSVSAAKCRAFHHDDAVRPQCNDGASD